MLDKISLLLAAVIILATSMAASAAADNSKNAARHAQTRIVTPRAPAYIDSDDPAVAGGGSLGYNQRLWQDDW